ncbi:peptide-methionine (S)-S-oxide reductase [Leptolyngbya ohadii]|uniref:peptide-methionine (S)-S-oxide reductase n=1 Tax=Leptolyngbya ohadii TaxID=1962290 RepID=UPI0021F139CA|nr:peptide-methionine (S)-S-oxide reductase [Leptolyngbya ohadii]
MLVSYSRRLSFFWRIPDPINVNLDRQEPDRGERFRSVIFYHTSTSEVCTIVSLVPTRSSVVGIPFASRTVVQ